MSSRFIPICNNSFKFHDTHNESILYHCYNTLICTYITSIYNFIYSLAHVSENFKFKSFYAESLHALIVGQPSFIWVSPVREKIESEGAEAALFTKGFRS